MPQWETNINLGLQYLEEHIADDMSNDLLALALIIYCLHLAERTSALEAYKKLMDMATEQDGFLYWQTASEKEEEENIADMPFWRRHIGSTSSSIEITSYALLTMAYRYNKGIETDVTIGQPTMKYLASQRNEQGGYHSTQDTVMALDALSEYARLPDHEQNVEISVQASGMAHTFGETITSDTALLLQELEIPYEKAGNIQVAATGTGFALVQLNVRYHACDSTQDPNVIIKVDPTVDKLTKVVTTKICVRWARQEPSGMFVIEMAQLSAYQVIEQQELVMRYKDKGLKRVETEGNNLIMYLDEVTAKELCMDVKSEPIVEVQELKAAAVIGYSYYSPHIRAVAMYHPGGTGGETTPPERKSRRSQLVLETKWLLIK